MLNAAIPCGHVRYNPYPNHREIKNGLHIDHTLFDEILKTYVSKTGKVNYKGLKKGSKKLDLYLKELSKGIDKRASKNEKLAFWINAYNAFTLKMIIDHYPVTSITSLHQGKPWIHSWIVIDKQVYSLDDIEHKIIRPVFKDPRIHFAVNCASVSCPPLKNKAFTAANLDALLEDVTTKFINSKANVISKQQIKLSPIFDWYKEDFGDVRKFIAKYSKVKPEKDVPVSYLTYDWNLNE